MQDTQFPVHAPGATRTVSNRITSSRLSRSVLIGIAVTLLLTCLEIAGLWILYPFHTAEVSALARLGTVLALPLHYPLLWLIPIAELIGISFLAFFIAKPLAIRAYLRDTQRSQAHYRPFASTLPASNAHKASSTPLRDIYEMPVTYYQHTPDPLATRSGQTIPLQDLSKLAQNTSLLLMGNAGTGKTTALHYCQHTMTLQRWNIMRGRHTLCLYIPLKNYNIFLQKQQPAIAVNESDDTPSGELVQQGTFLNFLRTCDLAGLSHLRPYLKKLLLQGRLALLCDGLDEIDEKYRVAVGQELAELLLTTQNRFIITCRELDYQEQPELIGLVNEGHIELANIEPLPLDTVRQFVERYIHDQGNQWQHTAGQIMQLIEHTRFYYICTNPFMLFAFLAIIDNVGIERGKTLDTRGRLLREYVSQRIKRTQAQAAWQQDAPTEQEVRSLLGRTACIARSLRDPDAIQLPGVLTNQHTHAHFAAVAQELLAWLEQHPTQGIFASTLPNTFYDTADTTQVARIVQFAQDARLITISPTNRGQPDGNVLSFSHELLADYFVAEYFSASKIEEHSALTLLAEDILTDIGYWSVPLAFWAGLNDQPIQLAEQFIALGNQNPDYAFATVILSLIALGVAWIPPQPLQPSPPSQPSQPSRPSQNQSLLGLSIPHSFTALSTLFRDQVAQEELAALFTRCADEGAFEIYHALFPLLMLEGIEEWLTILDPSIVPEMLFTYLQDTAELPAYENQVKRLSRVLWGFGDEAVPYASTLSKPTQGRGLRLRSAAINILGGTQSDLAVEPLMDRLSDNEKFIVERAINALLRLGPDLILDLVLEELENHPSNPLTHQVHTAILTILGSLLIERKGKPELSMAHFQRVLDALALVLGANYSWESDIQQQARTLLVRISRGQDIPVPVATTSTTLPAVRTVAREKQEQAIDLLIRYLASGDEMLAQNVMLALQEIGSIATPYLLDQLHRQPPETERMRIVEILQQVQDNRALPDILRLVADNSPLVQKQVTTALQTYGNESITGLIDLILTNTDEQVAERAAHILKDMGEKVVIPTAQALSRIVPGRTRLLVMVLDTIHDPSAISALTSLLRKAQNDPLLTIAVIHALSHFTTRQVVPPILSMLTHPQVQVYEEAIDALSTLGLIALDDLLAALDTPQETPTVTRVQRAILGIAPFPGEQLLDVLPECSNAQAQHIMAIFRMQGSDAAHTLVQHLFHKNERTRRSIRQTLSTLPGPIAVPPLLEALNRFEWRPLLTEFLLTFPEAAIPPLVNLLGDPERGKVAADILPQFGPDILPALVSGLDDPRMTVQEHAHRIIIELVHQDSTALQRVVRLFALSLPLRAHESLLEVLTDELVEVSIPALLDGLEDAHLIDDVSEALVRLTRKRDWQQTVLSGLLSALRAKELRRGAETALINVGALAVRPVGELITDKDQAVARAAQHILSAIGVPALSFIWTAHGDTSNQARREAAMNIFRSMPTDTIKDALVELLGSDRPEDMAMAQALLLERIHDESTLPPANREMIPDLLGYVQIHDRERTSVRILALLLLLGGNQVTTHLVQVLYDQPDHHEQLSHAFLFLGDEGRDALINILNDLNAPTNLRAEAMSILGLLGPYKDLYEYAQSLSSYGLSPNRTSILKPDQLTIALRALGSLLASGDWDIPTLQNLRKITPEGSAQSELYHVLLGWRYEPEIARLRNDLQNERDARNNEIRSLTARIVQNQAHIREIEEELEQVRQEHGLRGDELFQATQEREDFRNNLEQTTQERDVLRLNLNQALQERDVFRANLEQSLQEKQALQAEIAQLESYNALLQQQIRIMRGTQ